MSECPQCQATNAGDARFCNQCGTRLGGEAPAPARQAYTPRHLAEKVLKSRAALQGERKRVTVLFVDIKDSTRLAQQAGAEAWHELLDRYFGILTDAVHRFEGTVNQYTGDGVMALFGAPVAHEDDAQRACRAALEIQREVRRYADELRLKTGINLTARVGLNTGEVIVGAIGDDLRMDYTAQGLTVHLAARLEQLCEPGRIYASRATAVLAEGYFKLRDLGETTVHGSDAPVRVYELEGEGAARTRLQRALARGAARFVGRTEELCTLNAAMNAAASGQPQVLAVVGVAGLGKSRLCHEFSLAVEAAGVPVLRASGVPYASAMPLYPVQTLIRERLGLAEQGEPEEQRRLAAGALLLFDAEAAPLLPPLLKFLGLADTSSTPRTPEEATADRARLFDLLIRLLLAHGRPQLLLVEDLHFADTGTEAFLAHLATQLPGSGTLLLCNFRPEYEGAWLSRQPLQRLPLAALGTAQLAAVARDLLGGHASVAALPDQLAERAAGNPFYVEEAVQSLWEGGHLAGTRGAYTLAAPISEWPIPDTVHALVAARIDRLPEDEKTLLQAAAVIGQQFCPGQLAQLSEQPEALRLLARLRARCFVAPLDAEDGEWAFTHALTQDVAYRAQLEKSRIAAHRRLAQLLEQKHSLTAPPSEAAVRIAHHLGRARDWQHAAEWNLQAARWAAGQDANLTAAQFRRAARNAEQAGPSPAADRLRVMALAGVLRMAQFADMPPEEAAEAYRQARALAEANGDGAALAELLISYATEHLRRGDAAEAVRVAAEAVQLSLQADAGALVERFRLALLLIHSAAGYPREGLELVERVCGAAWLTTPVDDNNFMSRGFSAFMLAWLGQLQASAQQLSAALAFVREHQRPASWMHATVVDLAWFTGDTRDVLLHARLALRQAEAHGSAYFRAIALRALGQAQLLLGDPEAALPLLEQTLPLVQPGSTAYQFHARSYTTLAEIYQALGRNAEAQAAAEAAIASAAGSHSPVWEVMARLAWLALPLSAEALAQVPEALKRVDALITQTGAEGLRPWLWKACARHAADEGAREHAQQQALAALAAMGAQAQRRRWAAEFGQPATA